MSVKNGAELLNNLIKDIVAEQTVAHLQQDQKNDKLKYFSLARFIPLLAERVKAKNAFARHFLVQWLVVLESAPDIDLVQYVQEFLEGLLGFLSDKSEEVRASTSAVLEELLSDVKTVAKLKPPTLKAISTVDSKASGTPWVPGEGTQIDYAAVVKIVEKHLSSDVEEIQITCLKWMNEFIVIAKDIMIQVSPSLLNHVLPLLAHSAPKIRETAMAANTSLFKLIVDLPIPATIKPFTPGSPTKVSRVRRESIQAPVKVGTITEDSLIEATESDFFDYESSVKALAVLFLDEHEETRIASLEWLLMLHNRSPKRILSHDETLFPALLKLLSDPSEAVIKRDLQLLAQISTHTDEAYFNRLVSNLLKLFSTDRKLLEVRGNLIIRQLCLGLHPERIYRSFAEILEKEEDLEFASIMVQNLSTILITAPELYEVRKRLKNLKDNFTLFVVLYRSWCHNPVASLALCLLAQMYEHAANLVHSFGDIEITVNFLLQVDKLVQLLESPVFTYLRLQLLEPERYYYLYKCLYGVLMLLPQSSAFATLRNRLNSVSALGYLPRRKDDGDTAKRSSTNKFSMDASKAQELLTHFNALQSRHERIRVRTEATTVRQRDRSSSSSRTPSRGTSKERDTSTMESDRRSSAAQLVSRNLKRLGK